jgi:hypothetical protein
MTIRSYYSKRTRPMKADNRIIPLKQLARRNVTVILSPAERAKLNRQFKHTVKDVSQRVTVSSARRFFLCAKEMARNDSALTTVALM